MRSVWVVALVLVAAPTAAASAADAEEQLVLDWRLPGCAMVVALLDVEPARVRAILPEGFEPVTWGPLGNAKVLVEFAQCGAIEYGNWEALVFPPPERGRDGVLGYYVKFDTLVQDDPTRERLSAWGLPVHDGSATVETTLAPGLHRARMEMESVGEFTLDFTLSGEPPAPADFPFLEYTPVAGGLAVWDVALRDLALTTGAGLLTLPPESRLAALAGATRVPVEVAAGEWSALEGTVATPAGAAPFVLRDEPTPALVLAATVAAGVAGAGAGWGLLRALGFASAYARISRAAAAAHPRRQAILALVRERPGLTLAQLGRALGLAPGVLAHHVQTLERHGYVVRRRVDASTHVFAADAMAAPPLPAARARVLSCIEARPGVSQADLAREVGVSRWTLSHHARRLERARLIRIEREGRALRYWRREDAGR